MIVYNYTKVQRREKRVYSMFNQTISQSGFSVPMLQVCGACLAVFTILGLIFCSVTGTMWYNPINLTTGSSAASWFYMIFVGIPIGLGIFLTTYKIQNYRVIDFIKLYLQPKTPLDSNGKKVVIQGYRMKTYVERL